MASAALVSRNVILLGVVTGFELVEFFLGQLGLVAHLTLRFCVGRGGRRLAGVFFATFPAETLTGPTLIRVDGVFGFGLAGPVSQMPMPFFAVTASSRVPCEPPLVGLSADLLQRKLA